jgi:thiol:disulfide interchange protein
MPLLSTRTWLGALLTALLSLFPASLAHAQPEVVKVRFEADRAEVAPGGTFLIAAFFEHDEGWHIQTNAPEVPPELGDFEPFATTLKVTAPAKASVGAIQWPQPVAVLVNLGEKPAKYKVFDRVAVVLVPVTLAADASGEIEVALVANFQACNDQTCVPPETVKGTVKVTAKAAAAAGADLSKAPFSAWKPQQLSTPEAQPQPKPQPKPEPKAEPKAKVNSSEAMPGASEGTLEFPFFAWKFSIDPRGVTGMLLLLGLAVCGGFLLNVMPCVLPVLPLKIVALSQAAGTKQRTLFLGLMMCLGVVAFWLALGSVIALSTGFKSASQIISTWWFSVGIGLLMVVMSLSLLGSFNVGVPDWAYAINPSHDTAHGSFLFGVLTAVLATPCVAPLAATAMGWAAFQPPLTTMIVFSAIGVGMAVPYLVLAANPQWVERVPRAGAGSEVMKQTMALFMFAVAAFFVGVGLRSLLVTVPYLGETLHWWFVAAFSLVACGWMILRTWQIGAAPAPRLIFTLLGLIIGGTAVQFARYQTDLARTSYHPAGATSHGVWKPYTPKLLAESRAAGKVVVVDFTAEWCLNCKALEILLNSDDIQKRLSEPDVVAIKADLTSKWLEDGSPNPAWDFMRDLKEVGPPILVIYGPGRPDFFKANSYTKSVVLDEIAKSRG